MLVRPVIEKDLNALVYLAEQAGIGLTNLVADKQELSKKILRSIASFNQNIKNGYYFFVLEVDSQVVGCSGIDVCPGEKIPFYTYKISSTHQHDYHKNIDVTHKFLHVVNDFDHETELCSLYLLPAFRNKINGYLLSYARLLYMACYPEKFTTMTFAEIRGCSDDNGISPFWEAIGRNFYQMDFAIADNLTGKGDKKFIQLLKPELPIYISLLPQSAQDVIGKPHAHSLPAVNLLKKQNFEHFNYVDIFDAGPTIFAKTQSIATVQQMQCVKIAEIKSITNGENYMLATTDNFFTATVVKLDTINADEISISSEILKRLNLQLGQYVKIAPLIPK